MKETNKIIFIAGAGISKEAPSNLPSWWEYNMLLLEQINTVASSSLTNNISPLKINQLENFIPTVAVSDFIVRRAMGSYYFPLLRLLDGSYPNNNHYAIAQLAKDGKLAYVITTNFDTLLEQAFDKLGVPYNLIVEADDYEFKKKLMSVI